VAGVLMEATGAGGAAVYVARDERDGDLVRRAVTSKLARAPLFGTEADLLENARRQQFTVVRLAIRKVTVGLVLLAPEAARAAAAPSSRGGPLDGIVRLIATQAASAFALRIERERTAGGAQMKDPSSSAYSFAYYVDVAGREIDRARRYGGRFSIATIVLGGSAHDDASPATPSVFDTGGPRAAEVGDRLLSAVTDIDVVARIDENEFHLLLPETDGLGAHAVRRRVLSRLAGGNEKRPVPRGVLVGVATFPHDGRDLAQLLRLARRRADSSARSIIHRLAGVETGLADLYAVLVRERNGAPDLYAPRQFELTLSDTVALATTAVAEALRGGPALVAVTHHAGVSLGAAVRTLIGSGRDGVQLHAVDTSASPSTRDVEALAVFAEHGAFALVGRSDGTTIRGCHAADPFLVDLLADRLGRAGGVRVLG
jgi:hypothetical protein